MERGYETALERKFCRFDDSTIVTDGEEIEGYASLFGHTDQGGDVVAAGAYAASLKRMAQDGRRVKMLWQHDPAQPIGVWDEVREDGRGLFVKGRLLLEVRAAREAHVLLQAGAIDGLSIGYRTLRAEKAAGQRLLHEIELWEVSLVTFPMLPEARVQATVPDETDPSLRDEADPSIRDETDLARTLAATFREARELLA
jgi:HK97 family phage prohead protease